MRGHGIRIEVEKASRQPGPNRPSSSQSQPGRSMHQSRGNKGHEHQHQGKEEGSAKIPLVRQPACCIISCRFNDRLHPAL
jgi:hypothetical protein